MLEWLKRHAWKACKLQKGFGGSNPPLSAKIFKTTCLSLLKHGGGKIFAQDARGRLWVFEVAERSEVGALESPPFSRPSLLERGGLEKDCTGCPWQTVGVRGGLAQRK